MKKLICTFSIIILVTIGLTAQISAKDGSCSHPAKTETSTSGTQTSPTKQDEKGQKYVCPMHPEVVSDKAGKCPKCGMALVPVKAEAKGNQ